MGGGISSAIARALGAGRRHDADALVLHAHADRGRLRARSSPWRCCSAAAPLYAALGGRGASLDAALTYSNVVFAGACWCGFSTRSPTSSAAPATWPCRRRRRCRCVVLIPLSPLPDLRLGTVPAPGRRGRRRRGGRSITARQHRCSLVSAAAATARSGCRLAAGASLDAVSRHPARRRGRRDRHGPHQLHRRVRHRPRRRLRRRRHRRLRHRLAARISARPARLRLRRAARRDGRHEYRRRPTRPRAACGLDRRRHGRRADRDDRRCGAALFPLAWLTLFGNDPAMLEAGARYLRIVGPVYGLFGLGMALYFASQGAGRLLWPLAPPSCAS